MIISRSPHQVLFLFGLILLVFGMFYSWVLSEFETVDIQLHDTYLVVGVFHIYIVAFILLGLLSLIYWFCRKMILFNHLTRIHVVVSIVSLIVILATIMIFVNNQHIFNSRDFEDIYNINRIGFMATASFILVQFILVGNILFSLLKWLLRPLV